VDKQIKMKLDILKENLNKGLGKINRIISTQTQLPILSNVLLTAAKNQLTLQSTNLETTLKISLGAKVEKEGSFTVPARLFSEFVSSLPAEKITLLLDKNQLTITCNKYQASINGLAPADFPSFPSYQSKPFLSPSAKTFSQIIASVAIAATTDDSRPVLNGIYFDFNKNSLSVVATDGYRLSYKKVAQPQAKDSKNIIIPASSLQEFQKIISEEKENKKDKEPLDIFQAKDQNQLVFQYKDTFLATRLIGGEFPDYQKIIPQDFTTSIEVDTQEFQKAIKVAAIFARESANIIKIEKQKDTLIISAQSPQVGENIIKLPVKQKGQDLKIAFNSRYLLDFLNIISSETLMIELSGSLSPGVFKIPQDNSYLHLIMPVRLQT